MGGTREAMAIVHTSCLCRLCVCTIIDSHDQKLFNYSQVLSLTTASTRNQQLEQMHLYLPNLNQKFGKYKYDRAYVAIEILHGQWETMIINIHNIIIIVHKIKYIHNRVMVISL